MPNEPADDLVTAPEATRLLGYKNTSSIARLVYESKLTPARKLPGKNGAYLFKRTDVVEMARVRQAKAQQLADMIDTGVAS